MLSIDDIELYIRGNGSITDESLNAYSITNESVGFDTDNNGISNNAMIWNAVSDRLQLASTVGNTIAIAMNDKCSVLITASIRDIDNDICRIMHQWDSTNSGGRSFSLNANDRNTDTSVNSFEFYSNSSGSGGGSFIKSTNNEVEYNTWANIKFTSVENGSNIDKKIYKNSSVVGSGTQEKCKEDSNLPLRFGALNDGNIQGNIGKMNNIIVFKREVSSLEEQFINKFGNLKRCA